MSRKEKANISEEIEAMDPVEATPESAPEATPESVTGEVNAAIDAKAAKYEEARVKRNEAKAVIRAAMKTAVDGIVEGLKLSDLLLAVGAGKGSGVPRVKGMGRKSMNDQILDMFRDEDGNVVTGATVSGMDIFNQFDIGYPRMKWLIAACIKTVKEKADRIWIDFDRAEGVGGTYRVWGLGEAAPENWGGYLPSDETLL